MQADPFVGRLGGQVNAPTRLDYTVGMDRSSGPPRSEALLVALKENPAAVLVAGATEIGVDVTKKSRAFPFLVSTEAVPELTRIVRTASAWRVGGSATLTAVEEAVGAEYPSLSKMLGVFAARQIRNRATLGGNLATASPIGDGAPVLLSLDAELVLASAAGERTVALADFFTAYRKTLLSPGEIILEIVIPRLGAAPGVARRSDFLKVSKRRELDISIVAAAFSVDTDPAGLSAGRGLPMGALPRPRSVRAGRRPPFRARRYRMPPRPWRSSSRRSSSRSMTSVAGPNTGGD